ncbi:MAG: hypothetical protein D8M61_16255 [Ignavibacteriae bacterium]|nr:hypothetical protein [Ignavibacteriota bacterium]
MQPFNHSTIQPCSHATMQSCSHAAIQSLTLSLYVINIFFYNLSAYHSCSLTSFKKSIIKIKKDEYEKDKRAFTNAGKKS